jgi:hypothetical protein
MQLVAAGRITPMPTYGWQPAVAAAVAEARAPVLGLAPDPALGLAPDLGPAAVVAVEVAANVADQTTARLPPLASQV